MEEKNLKKKLKKFMILFVAICFFILIVARVASTSLESMYHVALNQQLQERAEQYKILFLKKIDADLQTLHALSSFLQFDETTDMEQLAEGLYKSNQNTAFVRMGYFTNDGIGIRVTTEGKIETDVEISSLCTEAQVAIEQAWQGKNAISNVYYEEYFSQNVVAYAVPIYTDTVITGVLFASQPASSFTSILYSLQSLSSQGMVAVMSEYGEILVATVPHKTAGFSYLNDIEVVPEEIKTELEQDLKRQESMFIHFTEDKIEYRICTIPLDIHNQKIVVLDTDENINALLSRSVTVTQTAGASILILAMIFLFFSYQKMIRYSHTLLNLAYYDALTGAYNRKKFNQLLEELCHNQTPCSVIAVNIRKFKFMNEIFGATHADQFLKYTKDTIQKQLYEGESVCRDTADSFFIIFLEEHQPVIQARLETIFSEIDAVAKKAHPTYPISFYAGIASTKDCVQQENIDTELMTHVMFALHKAKSMKQVGIWFYDVELHEKEKLQNYIESHMKQALQTQEFQLYLQPKVNLKYQVLSGAEALVRWTTSEGKMIFPDQFIPLFEKNGFCVQLDLYMVEQVCKQLRAWLNEGYEVVPISINQTKLLFYEEGYVKKLCEITQKYDISPSLITLEILEGLTLEHVSQINDCIAQLHAYGFRISMDDFGSGYSSLNTLGKIEIDELKLDRTFLLAATEDKYGKQRNIMESIIDMAKKLNIDTVAEGMETKENEQMMQELQCDYGQGYYYSRPISSQEFEQKFIIPFSKRLQRSKHS